MKRLVPSLLAISLCVSPAVVRESQALDIFTVFNQGPKNQTNIQHLKEECEREKALRLSLSEQKNCIMFGQDNVDEEIKEAIERFKNSDKLKELSQTMFNLSYKAISDVFIEYYKEMMDKGTDISGEKLNAAAALEASLDGLKNSEEAKNLINYCRSGLEEIRENYSGKITVQSKFTANNGEKTRASEIINNNKRLLDYLCKALQLDVMECAVNKFFYKEN